MEHFLEYFDKQPPWVSKYIANLLLGYLICFGIQSLSIVYTYMCV